MHRLGLAREARDQLVGSRDSVEHLALGHLGHLGQGQAQGLGLQAVKLRKLVLVSAQKGQRRGEHAIIERRLDVKHVHVLIDDGAHAAKLGRQHGMGRIHQAVAGRDGVRLVVDTHAFVVAQPNRDRLVAPVHGHQGHIQVDDQIALHAATADIDRLTLGGLAQRDEAVRILGVEVVVAVRVEGIVDLLARHALHLRRGHAPMRRAERDDDVHVVDPVRVEDLDENLEHGLPDVGRGHGRQGQTNVVHRDGHAHAGRKLGIQRLAVERMVDRVADSGAGIGQALDGRLGVDDPGADGQILAQDVGAREDDPGRRVLVDVDDLVVFLVAGHGPTQRLGFALVHRGLMLTQIQNGPVML